MRRGAADFPADFLTSETDFQEIVTLPLFVRYLQCRTVYGELRTDVRRGVERFNLVKSLEQERCYDRCNQQ